MLAAYARRGVTAGVIAGLVFGLFLALVANPLVVVADELGHDGHHAVGEHRADATGDHHGEAGGDHHGEAGGDHQEEAGGPGHDSAVSTTVANAVSILSGVLWGVLLGGVVFGIAYYFLEPAIPGTGGTKSYLLAAAGFVTVSGAPWLVLPPRPPGVDPVLPTETRLVLYAGMMVAGALVCLLAGVAYGRLRDARGRVLAIVVAALPVGLFAIPAVLSPANAVESSLPPELATGLTGTIVFGQAVLWLLLAGTHARLRRRPADGRTSAVATSGTDAPLTSSRG